MSSAATPNRLRSTGKTASVWLFIATLAWAPFPLGGAIAWAAGLQEILIALCWLLWVASSIGTGEWDWSGWRIVAVPLALAALVLCWATIQITPDVPAAWAHPVWAMAADALRTQLHATISLNPWRTESEIVKLSSYVLAALLAGFLLLAIAGWFLGSWPARRWSAAVAALIVLAVIGISVAAPGKLAVASETLSPLEGSGVWQPWSQAAVSRSLAAGQPVFVDFTASWCLSCQVNERAALSQPEVVEAFQAKNVVLMKADWTRHDEAITQALTAIGRSGVPAYALYAPGQSQPQMLPEVLTPGIVTDVVGKLPKTAR